MESPGNLAVSSTDLTPTGFYSQKLREFIFLTLEPWTVQSGLGLESLAPKGCLLIFIHHMWMWGCPCQFHHPLHLSTPHRIFSFSTPVCISTPPTRLDECSFFKSLAIRLPVWFSDSSGCYLFWGLVVILSVVACGGKACLCMPLSWPEVHTSMVCKVCSWLQYNFV